MPHAKAAMLSKGFPHSGARMAIAQLADLEGARMEPDRPDRLRLFRLLQRILSCFYSSKEEQNEFHRGKTAKDKSYWIQQLWKVGAYSAEPLHVLLEGEKVTKQFSSCQSQA